MTPVRTTMLVALLLAANTACDSGERPASDLPNVVYFLSDAHRWGAMSFTQTPHVSTPNMDTLRRQGVSLNRYYVNLPVCTPYRALMMTGRWPYQQGIIANEMFLRDRVDSPAGRGTHNTLTWAFKDAGYATALFGKWHLGRIHEFDLPYVPRWVFGGEDYRSFGFDHLTVWNATNEHRGNSYQVNGGRRHAWQGESNSHETTRQALDWMETAAANARPFFAIISVNPPHSRLDDAPESKMALYPDESALPFHPLDQVRDFESHRGYHAHISAVDDDIGAVTATLDELGISENTIFIYTSDHGGMGGVEGRKYDNKRLPHDESVRVPFLARWPGRIPAGLALDVLGSTIDVFPTLAALTGVRETLKAGRSPRQRESAAYLASLPGVDLSAFLLGRDDLPAAPESVFLSHPSAMHDPGGAHKIWRAIVTRDFTYAVTDESEYRLWKSSPAYQERNWIDDPAYLDVRRDLWRRLDRWMDRAERPFYDNWFRNAPDREIGLWNAEHGLDWPNFDRVAARTFLFDLSKSRPPEAATE